MATVTSYTDAYIDSLPTGGSESLQMEQTFAVASTIWTIIHNFGTKGLTVKTYITPTEEIVGEVVYEDENVIQVKFYYAQSGFARVWN